MKRVSEEAADFHHRLAQLADRLAARDIVVARLHADWSGSWEIHVERGDEAQRYIDGLRGPNPMSAVGPEVLRFFWDGRDGLLTVETSPTRVLSVPNEWKFECGKSFDLPGNEALQFVEDYLTERFAR
jgi:hypothetical protein